MLVLAGLVALGVTCEVDGGDDPWRASAALQPGDELVERRRR